jgi:flagellar hook protein FlgE
MFTSFSTALSALNANSTAINVVGNNLANLNTTGFKESVVSFHDLVSQSMSAGQSGTQVGLGVATPLTVREFAQGTLQASTGELDAAIQGSGFFILKDPSTGGALYTRAGDFQVDKSGNLLTSTGQSVQGWMMTNGAVDTNGAITDIQIPMGQSRESKATTTVSVSANLNSAAVSGVTTGSTADSFSMPINVVDSLGNSLVLTETFTKDPSTPLQWTYQITVPGDATTAGKAGTPTELLSTPGVLTFDTSGKLVSPAAADGSIPVAVTGLASGAADLDIKFSLYGSDGAATITQFSQPSATSALSQDGIASARITGVAMGDGGQVLAKYSDGTSQVVAQVALTSFQNPASLLAVGNNNYQVSPQTSERTPPGAANTGALGDIKGGELEASTVDVAKEFTNLIVLQRAYQANGKVITTGDQLSQVTISLMT